MGAAGSSTKMSSPPIQALSGELNILNVGPDTSGFMSAYPLFQHTNFAQMKEKKGIWTFSRFCRCQINFVSSDSTSHRLQTNCPHARTHTHSYTNYAQGRPVTVLPNWPSRPQQVPCVVDTSDLPQLAVQHTCCRLNLTQTLQRWYILVQLKF